MFGTPISRREAMRRGIIGLAGLLLANKLSFSFETPADETQPSKATTQPKAKAVIQVFLWGGMSHTDTWDPKPDAGYDYTGSLAGTVKTERFAGGSDLQVFTDLLPWPPARADRPGPRWRTTCS